MNASPPDTPRPISVGLYGHAGAGKDTIAAALIEAYDFQRVAFADPVRDMALAINPLVPVSIHMERTDAARNTYTTTERLSALVEREGWEWAKRRNPEVRPLLERIGTDAVRSIAPSFWIDRAMATRFHAARAGVSIVFTDVRFPNEADAIRDQGGLLVRIDRPVPRLSTHASATSMSTYVPDLIIDNEGPLSEVPRHAEAIADLIDLHQSPTP